MPPASESLESLVQKAENGKPEGLFVYLTRRSRLPGPHPNLTLARAAAVTILSTSARKTLETMAKMDVSEAHEASSAEFLPIVGVIAYGLRAARLPLPQLLDALAPVQRFAEDPRRHVREAVPIALQESLATQGESAVQLLGAWMDGYLQSVAVLAAVTAPEALERLPAAESVARLDDALSLVAHAPRAHQRSHGYRSVLRALRDAVPALAKRFPTEVLPCLENHASTQSPDLRNVLSDTLSAMRGAGLRSSDVAAMRKALDESAPVPRDPRSYVGPTRKRGGKARRQGRKR